MSSFQTLEDAVLCFYQSNNPKRDEAQKLLTELQNSPEIWRIIWEQMLMSKVQIIILLYFQLDISKAVILINK